MRPIFCLLTLALLVGGCGAQAAGPAQRFGVAQVSVQASPKGLHTLVLDYSSNWPTPSKVSLRRIC